MYIVFLVTVTAALISTAAYFSVFGIASMFAYNYVPAMIMGITLESSKIGVAVYLFRYWTFMSRLFKTILIIFLVSLMFVHHLRRHLRLSEPGLSKDIRGV